MKENEENLLPEDIPEIMIKGSSLNRKGTIKEGMNVRIPGTRKNAIRKNLGKYNRLILSS